MVNSISIFWTWLNAEAWRLRLALVGLAIILALVIAFIPTSNVFAGHCPGSC